MAQTKISKIHGYAEPSRVRVNHDTVETTVSPAIGTDATPPKTAYDKQTDLEAMEIFRKVSKRHHSLWVSLAKP